MSYSDKVCKHLKLERLNRTFHFGVKNFFADSKTRFFTHEFMVLGEPGGFFGRLTIVF